MTEIVVVRHGQASFGQANYDALSAAGHRQSQLLGEWLATHGGSAFDLVLCGGMVRHRETLAGIEVAYADRGTPLPAPQCMAGFNEFDHQAVLAAFAAQNLTHPSVHGVPGGISHDPRAMYAFLRDGLGAWATGALDAFVPEPWRVYRERIREATAQLCALAASRERVLLVTSGGPMSQLAQLALDLPDARAVELNLTIRNSAICEFHSTDGGLRMASWNALPHLSSNDHKPLRTNY